MPSRFSEDRYEFKKALGTGGAGEVWLAFDRRHGLDVAVKRTVGDSADEARKLREEFATLSQLHHPNLVELFDFGRSPDGRARFSMEYVEGRDLLTALREEENGSFPDLAFEVLRALNFLHGFGIVHRDLKSENMLVRDRAIAGARVSLIDFGLAFSRKDSDRAIGAAGTLQYIAPELFRGETPGPRSDLYALGVVLHEAIHGVPPVPFDGVDIAGFIERSTSRNAVEIPVAAGYPAALSGWLAAMTSPDPARRPPSSAEALSKLAIVFGVQASIDDRQGRAARLKSGEPPAREQVRRNLLDRLAPADPARLIFLVGEPGSGKTRLLNWGLAEAIRLGWNVRDWHDRDGDRSDLTAEARQTVLHLDDLGAADAEAIDQLRELVRKGPERDTKAIVTVRPGDTERIRFHELLRSVHLLPGCARLDLARFDLDDLRELLARAIPNAGVSEQQAEWLSDASEGIPSIAESLIIESAWERGDREIRSDQLERATEASLRRLGREARHWLELLCAFGGPTPDDRLVAGTGLNEVAALAAAEETRLLALAARRNDGWAPASRIVVRLVLAAIDPARQRAVFEAAAKAQATVIGGSPLLAARLWARVGNVDASLEAAKRAATIASERRNFGELEEACRVALRMLDRRSSTRLELRTLHAEALQNQGRLVAAARARAGCALMSADPERRIAHRIDQVRILTMARRLAAAERIVDRTLELALAVDSDQIPRVLTAKGVIFQISHKHETAIEILSSAVQSLRESGETSSRAEGLHCLATSVLNVSGDFDRVRDLRREALSLAERDGDHALTAKILIGMAITEQEAGDFASAENLLRRARRLIEEKDLAYERVICMRQLNTLMIRQGRLDAVLTNSDETLRLAISMGNRSRFISLAIERAEVLVEVGRAAQATALLRDLLAPQDPMFSDLTMEAFAPLYLKLTLAESLLTSSRQDLPEARALLEDVGRERPLESFGAFGHAALILELLIAEGDHGAIDQAWSSYERVVESIGRSLNRRIETRAHVARAKGLIHTGRATEVPAFLAPTLASCRKHELPDAAARVVAALVEAHLEMGDPAAAEAARKQGLEFLHEAADRILDPELRQGFLDREIFRPLTEGPAAGSESDQRLLAVYDMIHALNSETDPEAILESMLDMALQVVGAERGLILLRDTDGEFSVRLARNLEKQTIEDAAEFSRNVVKQAGSSGKAVISIDTGHDERMRDFKSVSMYGIRSVICVPLNARGELIGAVYLDNRKVGALFTEAELEFLQAFADHAALALENARIRRDLEMQNRRLQKAAETRSSHGEMIGGSAPMQKAYDLIDRVAETNLPVLVRGESGTGKELVARALHFGGPRRKQAFLTENCAAISEGLLESELFGHVKGAFTGADRDRTGLFEQADGGTLFLDEVGDMSPAMQARLLRVLQEGELRRVGGDRPVKVDVRVVAATHRDLRQRVREGTFREDLLYRLQVLLIELPPLRERHGDLPLLVEHFMARIAKARSRPAPPIRRPVLDLLERYAWPGNVRQLESTLQRLVLLAGDDPITLEIVRSDSELGRNLLGESAPQGQPIYSLEHNERQQIEAALRESDGNRTRAARLLGISRATIFRKIKEYGLS